MTEPERTNRPGDQPLPMPNNRPSIQSLVRADLDARERLGVQRYGTALQPFNGRDGMRDLYEELLDAACYARQLIEERAHPHQLVHATDCQGCEQDLEDPSEPPASGQRVLHLSWHPNAIRAAVDRALAILKAEPEREVFQMPGGSLFGMDLACLIDAGRAALGGDTDDD